MQDFVFNWVATGVVLWTAAFLAARKALPHRSFDFCSRLVSTMHACTAVGLATFSVQDWSCPVCPLGAISSPCQMKILSVTLSYLIYDAVCSLFDKRVDVSNLVHHTVGIVGILAGLAYEMCGSEMVATMWITEISSPFLHLREFLKEVGYKDTDLNLAVDILFAVTFSLARMVCGPYLVTVTLMADYPLLIKRKNQRLNPVTILHTNKRKKQRLNPVTMSGTEIFFYQMFQEEEIAYTAVVNAVLEQVEEDALPRVPRRIMNNSEQTGEMWMNSMLNGHETRCYHMFRLHPNMFLWLLDILVSRNLIVDARSVSAKQQLAMFLHAVGHGAPTGALMEHFQHSSQTVSFYVNKVAFALASLKEEFLLPASHVNECHPYIANSDRFYPYFKDALGAIDGTHIPANVEVKDHPRFRNRKLMITQNVMAAVSFDLLFQYACVGWEGSSPDMKVLRWALSQGGFNVPVDKYYLVDAGYGISGSFLAPYRGHRYHISSFRRGANRTYENKKEKFNHRHAQLRNCVERAFGVLKMRFQTLREGNMYPFATQKKIVWACLIVHNFIRREHGYDYYFNLPVEETALEDGITDEDVHVHLGATATAAGEALRDGIADQLWAVGNV